jgi:DNA topoisomerase-1
MAKNLVIVESPAKAKTIQGYLGKDFVVKSSFGHIRDLPKKGLSIDVDNNFEPQYEISEDKKKTIAELRKEAKTAETVWLASDEDREGEAIAWHLSEALKLKKSNTKRIVFHEITKPAITEAVKNPRDIDIKLVDAQQARRVLDRLVGYKLSPVLWKKIRAGLSAGRVQSVAVRLVVEKEREIEAHQSESVFKLKAIFTTDGEQFEAELDSTFDSEKEAEEFLTDLIKAKASVSSIEQKEATRNPGAPFTTSTLQQTASTQLGFSPKATMQLAQKLYEAGKITYMRTDSLNLSKSSLAQASEIIKSNFGPQYHHFRTFKTKSKGAQEAHEAIRPTDLSLESAGEDERQRKLYNLIRSRTLASQMAAAKIDRTIVTIDISGRQEKFIAKGEVITFDGFLRVSPDKGQYVILPRITKDSMLLIESASAKQTFSKPPARYSEASLVKKLEELGIGRPSTYAPTISTIQDRQYVEKGQDEGQEKEFVLIQLASEKVSKSTITEKTGSNKGRLVPTDTGRVVTDFLIKHFEEIIDYDFTKNLEEDFDLIANGERVWQDVIKDFYKELSKDLDKSNDIERSDAAAARQLGVDPKTNRPVFVRLARFGPVVQLGDKDKDEKLEFAPLPKGTSLENVTFEQALKQLELPRTVGQTDKGEDILANFGPYGPYIKVGKMYINIEPDDPFTITLEKSQELIQAKLSGKDNAAIQEFQDGKIKVLKGRFGPYVTDGKVNATIPKSENPDEITESRSIELIEAKKLRPPSKRFSKTRKSTKK